MASVRNKPGDTQRRMTIIDLAREAGVSKSTASRVINGTANVSPEARARVLEAISRTDFRANAAARALRTDRSSLVGLLIPGIRHVFYSTIAEVLERDLRAEGISLLIASSGGLAEGELLAINSLRSHGADAFVVSLVNEDDERVVNALRAVSQPIVVLDRELDGLVVDAVLTDPTAAVEQVVAYLADLGHTRLGLITHPPIVRPGRQVRTALRRALGRHQLPAASEYLVPFDRVDVETGWIAAEQLVTAGVTAILSLCSSPISAGVIAYLNDHGLRFPEDISLVVYDETELSGVMRPGLTTFVRTFEDYARYASRLLITRLSDPSLPGRLEVVTTRLVIRDSTGPAPRDTGVKERSTKSVKRARHASPPGRLDSRA